MQVMLRGYPEAVAAQDQMEIETDGPVTPWQIADAVATGIGDPRVRDILFGGNGALRATTRVLDGGQPVAPGTAILGEGPVTLLAVLPCDG